MKRIKMTGWGIVMMLACFSIILVVGCSNQSPISVDSSSVSIPPPPMTDENIAAGPIPGYSYLPVNMSSEFNGMGIESSMFIQRWVLQGVGGSVYFTDPRNPNLQMTWWHGVTIPAAALSENVLVGVYVPDTRFVVVDYTPSPYQFEGNVQIELSYRCAQIGILPEDMVMMYWDETIGEYEIVPSVLNTSTMKLYGTVDHFSRYIIATGGGS